MGDLGDRLARGDRAAFAELYDACADRVHHYLVVRLGSRDDADDLLQQTFLRMARAPQNLATVENLPGYVFTIARNEAARLLADTRSRPRVRHSTNACLNNDLLVLSKNLWVMNPRKNTKRFMTCSSSIGVAK